MIIGIKLAAAAGGIAFWLWSQRLLHRHHTRHQTKMPQIQDHVHRWTSGINSYLYQNKPLANALLIISSLVVDFLGLYLIYQGIFGPSIRPLLGLLMLFTLRQLSQLTTSLPTPEGMIWRDPGFPSLLVTYGVSNDLFFSGHTALAVFAALELFNCGHPAFAALAVTIIVFEVSVVLLLRAHWTMDVFAGALAALWISEVSARLGPWLDSALTSIR